MKGVSFVKGVCRGQGLPGFLTLDCGSSPNDRERLGAKAALSFRHVTEETVMRGL